MENGYLILESQSTKVENDLSWNCEEQYFYGGRYSWYLVLTNSAIPDYENIMYWETSVTGRFLSDCSMKAAQRFVGLQYILSLEQIITGMHQNSDYFLSRSDNQLVKMTERARLLESKNMKTRFLLFADGS